MYFKSYNKMRVSYFFFRLLAINQYTVSSHRQISYAIVFHVEYNNGICSNSREILHIYIFNSCVFPVLLHRYYVRHRSLQAIVALCKVSCLSLCDK